MSLLAWFAVALRASFVLALALSVRAVARRASAALRRGVLLAGLAASLALPLLALPFPGRPVVRVAASAVTAHVVAEALATDVAPRLARPARISATSPTGPRFALGAVLASAWALASALLLARALWGQVSAQRLIARAGPLDAGARICPEIEAPVVVGALRPAILLPRTAQQWSAERRRAVMLHESAHVRRRDGLALLIAQIACALYWFQPLAWLALRGLRRECELAADEDVIAAGMRPTTYAEHLLQIARAMVVPTAGIAMAARPSELGRRIQVLVSRERLPAPFTRAQAVWLGAASLLVLGLVACTEGAQGSARAASASVVPVASLDKRLQSIADDEALRVHREWGARRVAIVVLEPRTGAVLAASDDAPGQPIVPASTLKPLTVAMALDGELITSEQRFDCGHGTRAYGDQLLRDAGEYDSLDAAEILAVSSNIGVSRIFDALGGERLSAGLRRFRVGAPPDIPSGSLRGAIIAIGEGSTTTPSALAAAYGVLANDGIYASPATAHAERIIKASTAASLRSMLEGVVNGERATGKAARVAGVRVGGKTGTSDDPDCALCAHGPGTFASFVGIVPLERPRWVIYVGVGGPDKQGTGGSIAAPVFARIATRALEH
jgi:cell division protein FtsI (penicillin-binding protein 3)